ncbi:hypothetical protein NDU88_000898 [Pleurodeles waltl]|uniref:Uncharacterized protein n=1 Tax=Pleurodeles waltl TaxID=8319 RepID=A0AAV7S6H4_PLEWA|nr:hypothetical protein NDU88_000898 [Pleurodeles waltl]
MQESRDAKETPLKRKVLLKKMEVAPLRLKRDRSEGSWQRRPLKYAENATSRRTEVQEKLTVKKESRNNRPEY